MMATRLIHSVSRWLLVVLLATFLSPDFGWQTLASHGGLAHVDPVATVPDGDHDHDHGHHHGDHDDGAHAEIGHLLSHLPVVSVGTAHVFHQAVGGTQAPSREHAFLCADAEPPDEPPRHLFCA